MKMMSSHSDNISGIYIISHPDLPNGVYKIGRALNIRSRMQSLKSFYKLEKNFELIHFFKLPAETLYQHRLEKKIHDFLFFKKFTSNKIKSVELFEIGNVDTIFLNKIKEIIYSPSTEYFSEYFLYKFSSQFYINERKAKFYFGKKDSFLINLDVFAKKVEENLLNSITPGGR